MFAPGADPNYGGLEDGYGGMESAFSEKQVRLGFIRKVFAILMVQLAVTLGFISIFVTVESVKLYAQQNAWMIWVAFILQIVLLLTLVCCDSVRRRFPTNFILLALFTLAEGFLLGTVSSVYRTETVMIAVGICAVVSLALVIFAFQTKIDFTMCSGALFAASIVFMMFAIITMFIPGKVIIIVYSSLGALLFSLYIVFDVQLMIGQKHRYSMSPEDYIFGALQLYLDIVNLFLMILNLVSAASD